jgi:hypothetical protein
LSLLDLSKENAGIFATVRRLVNGEYEALPAHLFLTQQDLCIDYELIAGVRNDLTSL